MEIGDRFPVMICLGIMHLGKRHIFEGVNEKEVMEENEGVVGDLLPEKLQ